MYDPSFFKAHSYCIGVASWAAAKGFSDSQTRQLGRWKSNVFLVISEHLQPFNKSYQ